MSYKNSLPIRHDLSFVKYIDRYAGNAIAHKASRMLKEVNGDENDATDIDEEAKC